MRLSAGGSSRMRLWSTCSMRSPRVSASAAGSARSSLCDSHTRSSPRQRTTASGSTANQVQLPQRLLRQPRLRLRRCGRAVLGGVAAAQARELVAGEREEAERDEAVGVGGEAEADVAAGLEA
eukprot:368090-Rhodomonas_salina.1